MLRAVCASSIGKRPTHEDNFLLNRKIIAPDLQREMTQIRSMQCESVCSNKVNLIAVSDGMGGHNAGEVASLLCVKALSELEERVQACDSLESVINIIQSEIPNINSVICDKGTQNPELHGMGATLVLFVNYDDKCAILNIGDSRAYSFDGQQTIQITKDHTEGQRLLDFGILTRKEIEKFPARKYLNRYLGYYDTGYILQADVFHLSQSDGMVLLCSDGVSDNLSNEEIETILLHNDDASDAANEIIEKSTNKSNSDNATAILIQLGR